MRMLSTLNLAVALAPALAVTGCAASERGRFPSLATRPAERAFGSMQPVAAATAPAPPPAPAAPDLLSRIAAAQDAANVAHRRFAELQPAAARLAAAARGAARGSEAWSVAQVALAGLDSARSSAMVPMADLDRLLVVAAEGAATGPDTDDLRAVVEAQARVGALIAEEDRTIAALRGAVAD